MERAGLAVATSRTRQSSPHSDWIGVNALRVRAPTQSPLAGSIELEGSAVVPLEVWILFALFHETVSNREEVKLVTHEAAKCVGFQRAWNISRMCGALVESIMLALK
jgi:hypothetical protein